MSAEIINFQLEKAERSKKSSGSELEICVSCSGTTSIKKDEPVEMRSSYVKGAGQFCGPCYRKNIVATRGFIKALNERGYKK